MTPAELQAYRDALFADLRAYRRRIKISANQWMRLFNMAKPLDDVLARLDADEINKLRRAHTRHKKYSREVDGILNSVPILFIEIDKKDLSDKRLRDMVNHHLPEDGLAHSRKEARLATIKRLSGQPVYGKLPKTRTVGDATKPKKSRGL